MYFQCLLFVGCSIRHALG